MLVPWTLLITGSSLEELSPRSLANVRIPSSTKQNLDSLTFA